MAKSRAARFGSRQLGRLFVGALFAAALSVASGPSAARAAAYDFALSTRSPGAMTTGQVARFDLTVTATGQVPNTGAPIIVKTTNLDQSFVGPVTAGGLNWKCIATGTGATCTYSKGLPPAGGVLPAITLEATASRPGNYNLCARVDFGAAPDNRPANNEGCAGGYLSLAGAKYDVSVRLGSGPVKAGQGTSLVIKPLNLGPSPVSSANSIRVVATLPASFSFSVTGMIAPAWGCTVSGQDVICDNVRSLTVAPASPMSPILLFVRPNQAGPVKVCSTISMTDPETNTGNNATCLSLVVSP